MKDSLISVIAIALIGVLIFVVPVMAMANRVDTATKTNVESLTTEFVNNIMTTGKLTLENYNKYIQNLEGNGNLYDVDMEFKILDENPGKKSVQSTKDKIGENVYYSVYTSQIMDKLNNGGGIYKLKQGDYVYVNVKNKNTTLTQQMGYLLYKISGNDAYTIQASQSGLVNATAK